MALPLLFRRDSARWVIWGHKIQDIHRFKIQDILLGFRIGKLYCFSVCTPEAIGCSAGHGLVPFLWSLCGEDREYITFMVEELEAGIFYPGSQPQPSTKTHQVAVSVLTFIGLVLKVPLTGLRGCVCWGHGQVMSPRNCP